MRPDFEGGEQSPPFSFVVTRTDPFFSGSYLAGDRRSLIP
jgi:hypothetical protein